MTEVPLPILNGTTFRPFAGPSDYAALTEVQNASQLADKVEEVLSVDEVANDFAHLQNCDPARDLVLAEVSGQLVGFARVNWRINDDGERIYWQIGYIKPHHRRKGIGRALLYYTEARARAHAAVTPFTGPSFLRTVGEDTAEGKNALLKSEGYPIIRYFCFMRRPNLDNLPEAPLPPGLEFRAAQPEHWRVIWAAKEEAFLDHWGHAHKSEADYQAWLSEPHQKPRLWQVVWDVDKNEVAATSLNEIIDSDNEVYGFKRGWVSHLGVRRPYRGRGVARAMLTNGMKVLREQGMTEAVLGVDAENPSGALGLYKSVGFMVLNTDAIYQKPLFKNDESI